MLAIRLFQQRRLQGARVPWMYLVGLESGEHARLCCQVAIKYSSFGKSTAWHGRWFALTTPQPGITMHFDFEGREPLADWKWTTIFLPQLKEGRGVDYRKRSITLTWLCNFVRDKDEWVDLDGCPGFGLNAPPALFCP